MTEPADDRPFRLPFWQLGLAIVAVVLVVVAVIGLTSDGDDGETATVAGPASSTSSTVEGPTSSIDFQAPPPRDRSTSTSSSTSSSIPDDGPTTSTSDPETTEPGPSTDTTATTTTTSEPSPTTTTTTPPRPAAAGPTVETQAGGHDRMVAALISARTQWSADAHPDGYVYRTRLVCFCPYGENEIIVGPDGAVEDQRNIDGEPEHEPESIDDLFDRLEDAVSLDAALIRASFDTQSGYPVEFFIDYDDRIADEEIGREIDWVAPRD